MEFCNRGDLQNLLKKAKERKVTCLKESVIWNIVLQVILGYLNTIIKSDSKNLRLSIEILCVLFRPALHPQEKDTSSRFKNRQCFLD